MKSSFRWRFVLLIFFLSFIPFKGVSQCFNIESILVDSCDSGGDEGYNEMVRFKVGSSPLNTSTMNVNYPANNFYGIVQNAISASKVAILNTQIAALGGCGRLIEPIGGVLPANAEVVLITSYNFSTTLNIFGALTQDVYIIFDDNNTTIGMGGHFGNFGTGMRTLTISFGAGGCSEMVTYDRSLLVDSNGVPGASSGGTVNYTPSGTASYTNLGCVAPVQVFEVDAGTSPVTACPGVTIHLNATAQGYTTIGWSAASGTFSNSASLTSDYTVPFSASGSITLTLTAMNSCGNSIFDTVTITINPTTTPTFNSVNPICAGAALTALPTTSLNGITGSWLPPLDNASTTVYNFTPTAGQCATSANLTITVNSNILPTFTAVNPICAGAALSTLPTTSLNGITGSWTPALDNNNTTLYNFAPNANQCALPTTLQIVVNAANTIPTFSPVNPICVGAPLSALPTTSLNGITGSWTPTLDNTLTTVYNFAPDANQCALPTTLQIVVNAASTIPTFTAVNPICVGAPLSALPTTSLNGITGSWTPALDNTLTTVYNFAPDANQCALPTTMQIVVNAPSILPTFNPVNPICVGAPLSALPTTSLNGITGSWSPALDNTMTTVYHFAPNANQCALPMTMQIVVNALTVVPTFTAVNPICAGDTLTALPTTSLNGITGSWSPTLNNTATTNYNFAPNAGQCALPKTLQIVVNPIVTPTFNLPSSICTGSTLTLPTTSLEGITGVWTPAVNNTATTNYAFAPTAGQCAAAVSKLISVNAFVTPTFNSILPICSGATLAPLPTTSLEGITGSWTPVVNNTATTNYLFSPTAGQCAGSTNMMITVNPTIAPVFNPIVSTICEGTLLAPLPTTSLNGITGSWSPPLNNTATTLYTFNPTGMQCALTKNITIAVNTKVTPDFATTLSLCNGGIAPPLNTISPNGISGTWSSTIIDNSNSLTYTFAPNVGECAKATALNVTITANPVLQEQAYICFNAAGQLIAPATIDTQLSAAQYTFSWTFGGNALSDTAPLIQATQVGTYQVIATDINTGCTITTITTVAASPSATASAHVNQDFAEVQQIIVEVVGGSGNFLYQLNDGPLQTSNIFIITEGGDYMVHVRDASGCDTFDLPVTAYNFPKFFTPNNDGYNDTWNVDGLTSSQNGIITIFDRYGKLIKQISADGKGWDGIYNGKNMPSTDYWFVISYRSTFGQTKSFRSHFSLKR